MISSKKNSTLYNKQQINNRVKKKVPQSPGNGLLILCDSGGMYVFITVAKTEK